MLIHDLDFKVLVLHRITNTMDVHECFYFVAIYFREGEIKKKTKQEEGVKLSSLKKTEIPSFYILLKVKVGALQIIFI